MPVPDFHAGADGENASGVSTPVGQGIPAFQPEIEIPQRIPERREIDQNIAVQLRQREAGQRRVLTAQLDERDRQIRQQRIDERRQREEDFRRRLLEDDD